MEFISSLSIKTFQVEVTKSKKGVITFTMNIMKKYIEGLERDVEKFDELISFIQNRKTVVIMEIKKHRMNEEVFGNGKNKKRNS